MTRRSHAPTLVYLIHMEQRVGGRSNHYCGMTNDLARRLREHRGSQEKVKGAKILHYCNQVGIGWKVVRLWPGEGRQKELELKLSHKLSRFCPICQGADYATWISLEAEEHDPTHLSGNTQIPF